MNDEKTINNNPPTNDPNDPNTYPEQTKLNLLRMHPGSEVAETFLRDDYHGFKWRKAFIVLPAEHLPGQPIIGIWWDASYVPKELR